MAPRGSTESPRTRRSLAVATLLVPLLLSSLPLNDAADGSPSPAPAPLHHPPTATPQHAAPGGSSNNKPRSPPVPRHPGAHGPHPPGAAHPAEKSGWWQRLNFGERFGIALAGLAVAMQVALGAFLCARGAQQLRRRRAAAVGKAEERQEQEAAAASTPA
ncbi:unnamed protein product [Urochloa humidicola]